MQPRSWHWPLALLVCLPLAVSAATRDEARTFEKQGKLADAEKAYAELVQADPKDVDALQNLARLQGWNGKYDESIASWSRVIELDPVTSEHRVARARVRYWKQQFAEARQELAQVLTKAPDFDALVLAGDVEVAAGQPEQGRAFYERAARLQANDKDLLLKLSRIQRPKRFRLDLGGGFDGYFNDSKPDPVNVGQTIPGRGVEGGYFAQLSANLTPAISAGGGIEELHWFGKTDRRLNLSGSWTAADWLLLELRFAATPSAGFLANWELGGDFEIQANKTIALLGAVKHLNYGSSESKQSESDVTTFTPGLRLTFGRLGLQGQLPITYSKLFTPGIGSVPFRDESDKVTEAGIVKATWDFSDAVTGWLGGARGSEALAVPNVNPNTGVSSGVITTFSVVTSLFCGASWSLDESWALRFDGTYEHRENVYDKLSAVAGVTYKF